MARNDSNRIYSATYSNVPVYELNVAANHVMRRRSDDWINATHILKVAEYDKPTRTRILEREVQKGVHEKVQGGYGKYQGTWIPLPDGKELAIKNNVFDKLRPIFDYVPGDRSPPPAPKHATAASSKPRVPRAPAQPRRQPVPARPPVDYDRLDGGMRDETPDNVTIVSESAYDDYDPSHYGNPRKRRRVEDQMSRDEKEHQLWADELLDYFMLQSDSPHDALGPAPPPPNDRSLTLAIDDKGHTALHWAAAMGDVEVCKDFIRRGARPEAHAHNGESALMRAVVFTNGFDRQNFDKIALLLIHTVMMQEWSGSTVFHHIANTTQRKSKYPCARYYMDTLLNKMAEVYSTSDIEGFLNEPDNNGDTAVTIAARYGARKCVRSLIGRHAAVDIPNKAGETADQLIVQLNHRRQERVGSNIHRQASSSPFQPDGAHTLGGAVQPLNGYPFDPLLPNGTSSSPGGEVYKSEAALTLMSQIIPLLEAKTKTLGTSMDAEVAEKDAEVAEAKRVLAMREAEREALRKQQEDLMRKEMEQTNGGMETDEQLDEEFADLLTESEEIVQREQNAALKSQLANAHANGDHTQEEGSVGTKQTLACQVLDVQRHRMMLIKQIVQNLSVAGMGDKQEQYKRLITGALDVKEDAIEALLPEIVGELEEARGLEGVGG